MNFGNKRELSDMIIFNHEQADEARATMKRLGPDHPFFEEAQKLFESLWNLRNDLAEIFRNWGNHPHR